MCWGNEEDYSLLDDVCERSSKYQDELGKVWPHYLAPGVIRQDALKCVSGWDNFKALLSRISSHPNFFGYWQTTRTETRLDYGQAVTKIHYTWQCNTSPLPPPPYKTQFRRTIEHYSKEVEETHRSMKWARKVTGSKPVPSIWQRCMNYWRSLIHSEGGAE